MKKLRESKYIIFGCFSPPVMLATFVVEVFLAFCVLLRGKHSRASLLIIAILCCLATFQLAEYQVCSDRSLFWMRIGYIAITLLPPLGMHLISLVTEMIWYKYFSYLFALMFISAFVLSSSFIKSAVCGGNYLMVSTAGNLISYGFPYYYYSLLIIALINIYEFLTPRRGEKSPSSDKSAYLTWLSIGYASFIVPTAGVYFLSPAARAGVPSIMCGFAVFLALVLVLKVYPISRKLDL